MPRCPDCNRFVSVEMAEPELDLELGDGEVTGNVRLVQTCADCGTELAEANLDVTQSFEFEHDQDGCDGDLLLSNEEVESDDRYEGQGRYAKHFYGANITATVSCDKCGVEKELNIYAEEQASFFDSLV